MHLLRPNPRALVPATLLLTALAGSVPPAAAWQSSTPQFVISNRYAVQGIDGDGWILQLNNDELNGAIRLDEADDAASLRFVFRESAPRDAQAVWIHCQREGAARVGYRLQILLDDGNGRPSGTGSGYVALPPPSAGAAWQRVALASPFKLLPGGLYHVLVDYADPQNIEADPDDNDHLLLWCGRARHPVPYLPYDPTSSEPKATYDDELAALVLKDGTQHCFLTKIAPVKGYTPVFLIEHTQNASLADPRLFGNPYNGHKDLVVGHDASQGVEHVAGERFQVASSTTVNYAAFLTGASGRQGSAAPAGPLLVEIYEQQGTGPIQFAANATLLPAGAGHRIRYHWNAVYFDNDVTLHPNATYYLVLSSPGSTLPASAALPGGYVLPADRSENILNLPGFPDLASEVPTYGLDSSFAFEGDVDASGRLTNVVPLAGGLADVGFVLGYFSSKRAVAMNDELDVDNLDCDNEFRTAFCGDVLQTSVVVRNLAEDSAAGTIFTDLRVLPAGAYVRSLLEGAATGGGSCALLANSDNSYVYDAASPCGNAAHLELPFFMCTQTPGTLRVKFQVELGWAPIGGAKVIDDLVPLEVWLNDGDCNCF